MDHTTRRYRTADGKEPLTLWLRGLKDVKAKVMILKRIERLEGGNFGACETCRDGVSELKIDFGPGYRVYFGRVGKALILLLCAGGKGTQQADIEKAVAYLADFKERLQ